MLKRLTIILIVLAMVACTERPTASNFSQVSDPNDKSDIGDTNGAVKPNPEPDQPGIETPDNPSVDYSQFNDKLIDRREMKGHDPVALAFGDNKKNLILVYIYNQRVYYRSSDNMGLTLNPEVEIKGTQNARAPYVFARGNKVTIAYSDNSTVYSVQGTFNPTDATIEFGQPAEIKNIKSHAQGLLGGLVSPTRIATFTGAGKDGTHLVLPITVADLRDPVSIYCVAFAYSVDGKNWTLGHAVRPNDDMSVRWNNYDNNAQTSKYLQAKVFKVNGNSVEMLAQPRWNGQARGIGVFNTSYTINYNAKNYNVGKTVASDAQSSFETVITGNGTYLIGAIERDGQGPRNIVLRKYKGQALSQLEKQVKVSDKGTASSVAVFGDDTIAVFVNEEYQYDDQANFNGRLVYKRFTPTYFDTHDIIGD